MTYTFRKWFFIAIVFLSFVAILGILYLYNMPHRNIAQENHTASLTAFELTKTCLQNEEKAHKKFLNQVILVSGTISDIDSTHHAIIIDKQVHVQFSNLNTSSLKTSQKIIIKGRFLGYDSLLNECRIDQAHSIN